MKISVRRRQQDPEPKGKTYVDKETGLTYAVRRGFDELVKPPVSRKTTGYGSTVGDILAHAKYLWTRDWSDPSKPGPTDLCTTTYPMGVSAGFSGGQGAWFTNIMAGKLVRGSIDRTPKKILDAAKVPEKIRRRLR